MMESETHEERKASTAVIAEVADEAKEVAEEAKELAQEATGTAVDAAGKADAAVSNVADAVVTAVPESVVSADVDTEPLNEIRDRLGRIEGRLDSHEERFHSLETHESEPKDEEPVLEVETDETPKEESTEEDKEGKKDGGRSSGRSGSRFRRGKS